MEKLSREGNMIAFEHEDFWQSMDTVRDKMYLEELWNSEGAMESLEIILFQRDSISYLIHRELKLNLKIYGQIVSSQHGGLLNNEYH